MATLVQLGETGQAIAYASGTLPANTGVCFNTSGLLRPTGVGDKPDGIIHDAFAASADVTYYKTRGNVHYVLTSGAPSVGDILACGAAGVFVTDAVLSANSCGKLISAADSDNKALAVLW